jgi:hypothetical protein
VQPLIVSESSIGAGWRCIFPRLIAVVYIGQDDRRFGEYELPVFNDGQLSRWMNFRDALRCPKARTPSMTDKFIFCARPSSSQRMRVELENSRVKFEHTDRS